MSEKRFKEAIPNREANHQEGTFLCVGGASKMYSFGLYSGRCSIQRI